MSFEETKARLIEEFDESQAAIRAQFGMTPPPDRTKNDPSTTPTGLPSTPDEPKA